MRIHSSACSLILALLIMAACSTSNTEELEDPMEEAPTDLEAVADIVSVEVSASLVFSVGIESPDTGCDQYANWWEVITTDGTLLYRRILAHSHITEQPFVRSGGPVELSEETEVYVRAHMHPSGYGGVAYRGSVSAGFEAFELDADFATELAEADPLPTSCAG